MMVFRAVPRGALLLAAAMASPVIAQQVVPGGVPSAPAAAPTAPAGTIGVPSISTPTITNQPSVLTIPRERARERDLDRERDRPRDRRREPREREEGDEKLSVTDEALEPRETNEFQEFIAASLGRRLPLFGHNLFRDAPSTFAPVENIPVTPDYIIGPGDELIITAWGQIDVDYRAAVERNGTIRIPKVGVVPVAGIRYQNITQHIRSAISRTFRNFDLMVTLGELRSVQIFVVGQARRPGSYTVSSLSTLVTAVFAAGGPSVRGSMRAIQLKRGSNVVAELDLYDLIATGDKSKDVALLPGDVIYFPPAGQLVALSGSVNSPAIFELKGPTNVGRLFDLAGGLTTTAQTRVASIERIDERNTRTVDQFGLDYDGLRRPLKDGDLVTVFSVSPRFENAVTLRGKVAAPLRYPYRQGMRIRDLIPDREALITADYYARQNISVRTEAATQGQLAYDVRRLSDEINWDYAIVERLNKSDLTTTLIPFNLGKVVLENDAANNLPLMPGDVVTVFSKRDVAAPAGRRPVVVSLEGEFNFAGVYQAQAGETLRQLVVRVGGITAHAYLFGAEFTRESTRVIQEERLKQAIDQLEQDVQRAAVSRAQSVLSPEDAASLKQEADAQRALVQRLKSVKPTGRVVLQMPETASVADVPEIGLEDGDRFYVPQLPSMVSVLGTVFNESAFLYRADSSVADYLKLAGGPRREADKRSIYVLRADGSVISTTQSGFFGSINSVRAMPGDAIVVPEHFARTTLAKDLRDWTQILYQFGLGAAALKVLTD